MIVDKNTKICVGNNTITNVYQGMNCIYTLKEHYLCISGGQYIDTGIFPTTTTKVETKIKSIPRTNPSAKFDNMRFTQTAFGSRKGYMDSEFVFWYDYAGTDWRTHAGTGSVIYSMGSTNITNALPSYPAWDKDCIVTLEYGKLTLTYDNETHEYPITTTGGFPNNRTLWLFNIHDTTENLTMWFNGDWYYTKIWDNDILVRDFVPALDQDGVPCLYDKISKDFFHNQGTGQFIYG